MDKMIQHFKFKSLYGNDQLPGWRISFYYKQQFYEADYKKDGSIEWVREKPEEITNVENMIHELMLFHVYE